MGPHTKAESVNIERVQLRAARFVFGDSRQTSSVSAMVSKLKWESLENRRKVAKAIKLYIIMHHLAEIRMVILIPTKSICGDLYLVPYARARIRTKFYKKIFISGHHPLLELSFSCEARMDTKVIYKSLLKTL